MKRLLLLRVLVGTVLTPALAGVEPPAQDAVADKPDPAMRFLELALASQHVKDQKGGPKAGFYLLIENTTTDPIQVTFSRYESGAKGQHDADGTVVCTHRFRQ